MASSAPTSTVSTMNPPGAPFLANRALKSILRQTPENFSFPPVDLNTDHTIANTGVHRLHRLVALYEPSRRIPVMLPNGRIDNWATVEENAENVGEKAEQVGNWGLDTEEAEKLREWKEIIVEVRREAPEQEMKLAAGLGEVKKVVKKVSFVVPEGNLDSKPAKESKRVSILPDVPPKVHAPKGVAASRWAPKCC